MPADAKLALRTAETAKAPQSRADVGTAGRCAGNRDASTTELPERPAEKLASENASPHRPWIRWALFALLPLALIAGSYWYVTGGQVMSTDDAYVEAETVGISTDVSGIVKEIDVTNNQHVDPGQVLYRLDPRQFQIALDNAKANLAQTALTIDVDEAGLPAHAERRRRATGAGRARSGDLRPQRRAVARAAPSPRPPTTRRDSRSKPTRASSNRCASRPRCSSQGSPAIRTFR